MSISVGIALEKKLILNPKTNSLFFTVQFLKISALIQYNEEGYTIVKNVLSDDEVLDAKKALDELIQR